MGVENRERRRVKKQRDRAEADRRSAHRQGRSPGGAAAGPPDDQLARRAVLATAEAFRSEPDTVYRTMLAGLTGLDLAMGAGLVDRAVGWAFDVGLDRAWDSGWQPADVGRVLARKLGKAHAAAVAPAVAASAARRPECVVDERWAAQVAAIPMGDPGLVLHAVWADRAVAVEALSLVLTLPVLPRLSSSSSARTGSARCAGGSSVAVLDRVRALLAEAESTSFPEEAEAFTAKAQELIARHATDEALLDARGHAGPGPVVAWRIGVDDPYADAKAHLLDSIARANRCRSVWSKDMGFSTVFGLPTTCGWTSSSSRRCWPRAAGPCSCRPLGRPVGPLTHSVVPAVVPARLRRPRRPAARGGHGECRRGRSGSPRRPPPRARGPGRGGRPRRRRRLSRARAPRHGHRQPRRLMAAGTASPSGPAGGRSWHPPPPPPTSSWTWPAGSARLGLWAGGAPFRRAPAARPGPALPRPGPVDGAGGSAQCSLPV